MSRCKQCNIEILEPTERCPLCNSVLEKSEDLEAMYPQIHQKARAFTMILRVYSFLVVTGQKSLFWHFLQLRLWLHWIIYAASMDGLLITYSLRRLLQ